MDLVYKTPPDAHPNLQAGVRILPGRHVVTQPATPAGVEGVQVFGPYIGRKTLDTEMEISGYIRRFQAHRGRILEGILADKR